MPAPHQLPPHPQQSAATSGTVPPAGPGVTPQGSAGEPDQQKGGRGITPVGLISVLVLLVVVLGLAFLGNRVWPINSKIDSAWRSVEGGAAELTDALRRAGYTCSDEAGFNAPHTHRLCANYDADASVAVEFAGTRDGQVKQVRISSAGPLSADDQQAVAKALDVSIPDPNHRAAALATLVGGASDRRQTAGPWGTAGFDPNGVFVVAGTWPRAPAEGKLIPGGLDSVRQAATELAYACSGTAPMVCQRTADAANWTLTVEDSDALDGASRVQLEGIVTNPDKLNVEAELEGVLPPGSTRNKLTWFVGTADQRHGQAGFADGLVVDYRVTQSNDRPTNVSITIQSPCRPAAGGQNVSC